MRRKILSKQTGITLIALVVTIVVLLILAGVSIAMLAGENGVIANAQTAKIESIHGQVKEAVMMKYGEYQIELKTAQKEVKESAKVASLRVATVETEKTFIEYLENKEYIDADGKIDTQKLTGKKLGLGNGEVSDSGNFDVYTIEEDENKYVLKYYDKDTSVDELSLWRVVTNNKTSNVIVKCPNCETLLSICNCGIRYCNECEYGMDSCLCCEECWNYPCTCEGEDDGGGTQWCQNCSYWECWDGICEGCGELEEECCCCEYCGDTECDGECIRCEFCGEYGCDCCQYCGNSDCEGDCYCPNCGSWDGCQCEEEEDVCCPECGNDWVDCECEG